MAKSILVGTNTSTSTMILLIITSLWKPSLSAFSFIPTTQTTSSAAFKASSLLSTRPSSLYSPLQQQQQENQKIVSHARRLPPLNLQIGLGPRGDEDPEYERPLIPGIDYEEPDHEAYRFSRLNRDARLCDDWFYQLLFSTERGLAPTFENAHKLDVARRPTAPKTLAETVTRPNPTRVAVRWDIEANETHVFNVARRDYGEEELNQNETLVMELLFKNQTAELEISKQEEKEALEERAKYNKEEEDFENNVAPDEEIAASLDKERRSGDDDDDDDDREPYKPVMKSTAGGLPFEEGNSGSGGMDLTSMLITYDDPDVRKLAKKHAEKDGILLQPSAEHKEKAQLQDLPPPQEHYPKPEGGFLEGTMTYDTVWNKLMTPVELKNEYRLPTDHPDYTPYVSTKLPWQPLVPAFGLEQFGLPTPRRKAEAWRFYDVMGMVKQSYSALPQDRQEPKTFDSDEELETIVDTLKQKGGWLEDDECQARLVYVNGRFCPQLSKTTDKVRNMERSDLDTVDVHKDAYLGERGTVKTSIAEHLARLTDGFTDQLASPVAIGDGRPEDPVLTSFAELSKPNHNFGDATSQFAINAQHGTACFAALNTLHTGTIAYIRQGAGDEELTLNNVDGEVKERPKPILLVNAKTKDLGADPSLPEGMGVSYHPRTLVIAEENSHVSLVQSNIDITMDTKDDKDAERSDRPCFQNGYTQLIVKENATVTHSYVDETGGTVTPLTELSRTEMEQLKKRDRSALPPDGSLPLDIEANRPGSKNMVFETTDAQIVGKGASYSNNLLTVGGTGRVRCNIGVTLLKPECEVSTHGFSLCGGKQYTDVRSNMHHIADECASVQMQKNLVGGRGAGSFKGRVRVEQSAQKTDSDQLSRTILLTDRCQGLSVPALEIIADDVKCAHGSTIADLSDEELYYLRSRGISRSEARNLLMSAYAKDICERVDAAMMKPSFQGPGLNERIMNRMKNLVPRGDRTWQAEYQSV